MLLVLVVGTCPLAGFSQTPGTQAIFIGQSAAFSGPAQALGLDVRRGMDAFLVHLNRNGGVNGRPVLLKSFDDQGNPELASSNARRLILEEGVAALIASVGDTSSEAVAEVAMSNSVPLIAPVSGAGRLRGFNQRFVYNVRAGYAQESQRVARQLSSMGLSSVAVVYQENAGGREGAGIFEIACRELGLKVVSSQKVGGTRASTQVAARAVAQATPNAVVLFATYDIGAEVIRASRSAGYGAMFMTVSSAGSKALSEELLEDARGMGMTQVMPYPWSGSVPLVREYQERMLENGFSQKDFSYGSLEGFVAARVVVEGLRRSGKSLSTVRLADALDNLGDFDLGGLQLSYSPRHREGSKFVDLTVMGLGGKFLK